MKAACLAVRLMMVVIMIQMVSHVGTWCKSYQEEFPSAQNVVAKCLDAILKNSKVRELFHPHHLMDSSRLRWGWKKYLEEENS